MANASEERLLGRWGLLALLLVVIALIGSVVIPARQTMRILSLLRETTETLAPAKVITSRLHSGLVDELATLRDRTLDAPNGAMEKYRGIARANRRLLDSLEEIEPRLDEASAAAVRVASEKVHAWWRLAQTIPADGRQTMELFWRDAATDHGIAMDALDHLSSGLTVETRARDDRVRKLERLSLGWNALLVVAAFLALSAVIVLAKREQRALDDAERLGRRETALRETAEAMAGAFTLSGVMQCVTEGARRLTGGRGAFIERVIHGARPSVSVCSVAGVDTPAVGSVGPLEGSLTMAALDAAAPAVVRLGTDEKPSSGDSDHTLVIPLGVGQRGFGAVFILSDRRNRYGTDDIAYAGVFGHLASLALEKVRVLDEAREGRQKLERVLASRSRLIRGFSHDVKNPVGAADGYAALLEDGIYGPLEPNQVDSIGRIRRSLRSALSLIHDLHELASAETGHLSVSREWIDVNATLAEMVEEYQAAARASGLTLDASLDPQVPMLWTSKVRLEQIVSNLLSNAIKYTPFGSVTVETMVHDSDPVGADGDWVQIHVTDTGPGIAADKQEIVFEEFSRIGPGDKSGAGLGLAISRLLAGALGGYLTVESEVGKGSRFTLWLRPGHEVPSPDAPASPVASSCATTF